MGHGMVAIGNGDLLVFGGRAYQGTAEVFLNDTWIFNTSSGEWRELTGPAPLARSQYALAYDSTRGEVLLFGGYVGSTFTYGDTWLFSVEEESWRRLEPDVAPTARAGSVMTFDPAAEVYFMFAGAETPPAAELPEMETWSFDPDRRTWSLLETSTVPTLVSEGHPTLFELAMVHDTVGQRSVLMVAGESTWAFDGVDWAQLDPGATQGLGADYMTAAAFDAGRGVTVAYGGAPVERTQQTWLLQDDVWMSLAGDTPGPLANHAMAYDPATDAVYLYGGASAVLVLDGATPVTNDMWRLGEDGWHRVP